MADYRMYCKINIHANSGAKALKNNLIACQWLMGFHPKIRLQKGISKDKSPFLREYILYENQSKEYIFIQCRT